MVNFDCPTGRNGISRWYILKKLQKKWLIACLLFLLGVLALLWLFLLITLLFLLNTLDGVNVIRSAAISLVP